MNTQRTQGNVGLTGNPIEHSLSPVIHQAAYAALGLDWKYSLYPCRDELEFTALINQLAVREDGFMGLNVTMPFKSAAYRVAERIEGLAARAAQAANVLIFDRDASRQQATKELVFERDTSRQQATKELVFERDTSRQQATIVGVNTDGAGIVGFLEHDAQISIAGVNTIICGTGPTSTAAAIELAQAGAFLIVILSREHSRAEECVSRLKASIDSLEPATPILVASSYCSRELEAFCGACNLIIDATSVGMNPQDAPVIPVELLTERHFVLDTVYGRGETQLVSQARARGARAFDGVGMLVEQAALSIEWWAASQGYELKAPRDIMQKAALEELKRREAGKR